MLGYADFGNTCAKLWIGEQAFVVDYDQPPLSLPDIAQLNFVSVIADTRVKVLVEQLFEHAPRLQKAVVDNLPFIRCGYASPQTLGVDRWVAACAGYSMHGDCLVVDAGTAITIDIASQGVYEGGVIIPGLNMMASALISNTDKINEASLLSELAVGNSTASAVANGALIAAVGAIRLILTTRDDLGTVVLTGGSAVLINNNLNLDGARVILEPNLIKKGLELVKYEELK